MRHLKCKVFDKELLISEPTKKQKEILDQISIMAPTSMGIEDYQRAQATLEQRHAVLMQAFLDNPARFNNKKPKLKNCRKLCILIHQKQLK